MNNTEHLQLMRANEGLIIELLNNKTTYRDWIIIITFYTALHKIDVLLHDLGVGDGQINNHPKRNGQVSQNFPSKIYQKYNTLYLKSKELRYNQKNLFSISKRELRKFLNLWICSLRNL